MSYLRFGAMILTSTLVMFGLMYFNTYAFAHVFFSQTPAWMAVVMGAAMAAIMLLFMLAMYRNPRGSGRAKSKAHDVSVGQVANPCLDEPLRRAQPDRRNAMSPCLF